MDVVLAEHAGNNEEKNPAIGQRSLIYPATFQAEHSSATRYPGGTVNCPVDNVSKNGIDSNHSIVVFLLRNNDSL